MAGTIVNNMTAINNAENTGDWTGGSPAAYSGFPREGTNCMGEQASNGSYNAYDTITSRNMSNETIHGWMLMFSAPDTYANVGFGIVVGDGTNRAAFQVGGSDKGGFAVTPTGWKCFVLSVTDKDDTTAINLAGTTASIDDTAITQIGYYFDATAKAIGNVDNVFWDILWVYTHTDYAVEISAGTSGSPATFNDLATYDASTATNRALGVLYEIHSDVFELMAPLAIGDDGTGASYFSATNQEIIFPDIDYVNNFKLNLLGNATGQNEIYLTGVTFRNAHSTLPVTMDFSNTNFEYVQIDGCSFFGDIDFTLPPSSANRFCKNTVFDGCGQIDPNTCSFTNNTIRNTTDSTTGAILLDASGTTNWSDLAFESGGTGHAIYITATGSYTLTNLTYSGYGSTGTTNAAVYNNSGGAVTLTISGGDTPTYYNGSGASTDIQTNPVNVSVHIDDNEGNNESGVQVWMRAEDATGDLPYEQSISSITRSGTTATVTFAAAHGLKTNDYLSLAGITDKTEDNWGAFQVTVSSTTVCTYTTTDSGSTNYQGTITGTGGLLYGTTDVNGDISVSRSFTSNQPVAGYAAKSTSSPRFKRVDFSGNEVSNSSGLTINRRLILDE